MNNSVSRRGFLRMGAAAALAVSCSGLLASCGSGSNNSDPNEASIGNFKVKVTGVTVTTDTDKKTITFTPSVRMKYTGKDAFKFEVSNFGTVFSAKVGGKDMSLNNSSDVIAAGTVWFFDGEKTAKPSFKLTNETIAKNYNSSSTEFKLTVKISNQSATFTVKANGTATLDK